MRIIYLGSGQLPSQTANSIQVVRMCQAFTRLGNQVELFARDTGRRPERPDIERHYGGDVSFPITTLPWPRHRLGGLVFGWNARMALRGKSPDVVYARSIHGLRAALAAKHRCVYEIHAPPANLARRLLEGRVLRHPGLRRVVFISEALRRRYAELFAQTRALDVLVAHDAADPNPAATSGRLTHPVRRVAYVGSFYPGKGIEVAIPLARALPDIEMHLLGGGRDLSSANAPPPSNVRIHGYLEPARVQELLPTFDVLLLPAQRVVHAYGGGNIADWMSPLKLFEYMASGRPIIASRLPVLGEVLRDRVNALLVDPEDLPQWIGAVRLLLSDDALAARLGSTALAEQRSRYTWSARAAAVLAGL